MKGITELLVMLAGGILGLFGLLGYMIIVTLPLAFAVAFWMWVLG